MSRIKPLKVEDASGASANLYNKIKSNLGSVPLIFQSMGATPDVLEAYFTMGSAAKSLSASDKEAIALVVGQTNACEYCVAAHTLIAKKVGLSEDEIVANRQARSSDPKRQALLSLVHELVSKKANVSEEKYQNYLKAGFKAEQLPEIALVVAQNVFTNYFNHLNKTVLDLPEAPQLAKAS